MNDALSAIQDIAGGRNPFEEPKVPFERGIGLIDVKRGSAVYSCLSRSPDVALNNLDRIGSILSESNLRIAKEDEADLANSLPSIRSLSQIAKSVGCKVVVTAIGRKRLPLVVVDETDYARLSDRMLVKGETTIVGKVVRAGGATEMRCLLRVPGRRRILYCNVKGKELVRRLGQRLYETIAATGTAVWMHRSWWIHEFTISDFSVPQLGETTNVIEELREAGLSAWDSVDDPSQYIQELRS